MRLYAAVARRLGTFGGNRSGSFAIMTAAIMAVLALSAGYAVNIAQLYNVRSNLRQALDAAVTSTARDITTGIIEVDDARVWVELFLKANGDPSMMDGDRIVLDQLTVDKISGTVEASAHVDVAIYFPLFGASNERRVRGESAALYSDKKIEVAMMLDVTDSMSGSKISDLKDAASNAVDALTKGQNKANPRVRIALVPYSDGVNVGALAKDVVFVEKAGAWDLPPPIDAKKAEINANTGTQTDNCATERKDENLKADFSDDAPDAKRTRNINGKDRDYYAKVNRDDRLNSCAKAVLKPLSPDADALKKQIKGFSVAGYTAGAIGVQWTYYMLSEKWRPAIQKAGLGDGPADADPKEVAKIAILMTDGEFNTAHADVSGDKNAVRKQNAKSRSYAESLCENMKADGIEIFSIGFKLNSSEARNVLKNCASPDTGSLKRYYETSTGDELNDAFMTIARNIEALVLTH
ncbi:TadE/TadG family type IV pilus assembly protein [Mesorhizobium sp. KR9-304]|uniref:TadE/TadG family type IV pilus assembly protein n=1 Tax=Mesorhizobium sp. KR9-304 TaxID=3156614 RepID=UPI0032B3AC6F